MIATRETAGKAIVGTSYEGPLGAPAIVDVALFNEVLALRGDEGAKGVLRRDADRVAVVECEAARVDVDTADDVARLRGGSPPRT